VQKPPCVSRLKNSVYICLAIFLGATLCVGAVLSVAWCPSIRPSVCPSVTLVYCIQKAGDIVKLAMFPSQRGGTPALPQLSGFPSTYAYALWRSTTKFDVVIHVGRGFVCRGQPHWNNNGAGPKRSLFWGSPISITSPFNAERPNSAW